MEVKEIIRKILDDKNVPKKDCSDMDSLIQRLARRFIAYTMEN